jgi:hypothetical protein
MPTRQLSCKSRMEGAAQPEPGAGFELAAAWGILFESRRSSRLVNTGPVMKYSKASFARECRGRRLSFGSFSRFATLLSFGATLSMLAMIFTTGQSAVLGLWLATIAAIWTITMTVGCFIMVPVGIWRIRRRLRRASAWRGEAHGQVWDRWMDGPEPVAY